MAILPYFCSLQPTNIQLKLNICQHIFELLPQKAIFWPSESCIILADLHLGKAAHFRKNGISLPSIAQQLDYQNLQFLINQYSPSRILILGDLFHSEKNVDVQILGDLITQNPTVTFELILGNHDILPFELYHQIGLKVLGDTYIFLNILFTHYPQESLPNGIKINFCGHLHPGYFLQGKARQALMLPSFVQTDIHLILPSFGVLTGQKAYEYPSNSTYYLVTKTSLKKVKTTIK